MLMRSTIVVILLRTWASPNSLLGAALGACAGGGRQKTSGVWEFHGGRIPELLDRLSPNGMVMAITFGHVILGRTVAALDICREHELVHVRQYERWGPLFIPAYLGCSVWLWLRGRDPYRDNPFEVEAYAHSTP